MLERLAVRDLALIAGADVRFGPGLNVVTGETGAGKSLLVQAVDLLLGGRADADAVRDGAERAVIEGEWALSGSRAGRAGALLSGFGIEFDGQTLIVRREVEKGGKSRALVNQSAVTLANLRRAGEFLADLHGQHEHQSLLRSDAGLEVLDRLGELSAEVARYGEALAAWREAAGEQARLAASLATFTERREWLEHAARELDQAELRAGEDETLAGEAARLAHADRLRGLIGAALERLAEGDQPAVDGLAAAARALEQAAALDPSLAETRPLVEEARIAAGEAARALTDYAAGLDADPARLEALEARRDQLAHLARKYHRDLAGLMAYRAELAAELLTGEDGAGADQRARARRGGARRLPAPCRGPVAAPPRCGARVGTAHLARAQTSRLRAGEPRVRGREPTAAGRGLPGPRARRGRDAVWRQSRREPAHPPAHRLGRGAVAGHAGLEGSAGSPRPR